MGLRRACAILRWDFKWRRENRDQKEMKGRCFLVFSLIQCTTFFDVAVVSWTGKHLSVSDGQKKSFLSNVKFWSPRVVILAIVVFLVAVCFIVITCKIPGAAFLSRSVWVDYKFICVSMYCTLSCQSALLIVFSFIVIVANLDGVDRIHFSFFLSRYIILPVTSPGQWFLWYLLI